MNKCYAWGGVCVVVVVVGWGGAAIMVITALTDRDVLPGRWHADEVQCWSVMRR